MTDKELIDFALTKSNATPKFKLKYFVGGAQLTPYATLRQWLMELRAREESLDSIRIKVSGKYFSSLMIFWKFSKKSKERSKCWKASYLMFNTRLYIIL